MKQETWEKRRQKEEAKGHGLCRGRTTKGEPCGRAVKGRVQLAVHRYCKDHRWFRVPDRAFALGLISILIALTVWCSDSEWQDEHQREVSDEFGVVSERLVGLAEEVRELKKLVQAPEVQVEALASILPHETVKRLSETYDVGYGVYSGNPLQPPLEYRYASNAGLKVFWETAKISRHPSNPLKVLVTAPESDLLGGVLSGIHTAIKMIEGKQTTMFSSPNVSMQIEVVRTVSGQLAVALGVMARCPEDTPGGTSIDYGCR